MRLLKRLFILVLIVAVLAGGFYAWTIYGKQRTVSVKGTVRVDKNDTVFNVAEKLEKQGIVASKVLYYVASMLYGRSQNVAVGSYQVASDMAIKDLVYTFDEKPYAKQVVIAPGLSKNEIGELVGSALGWGQLDRQFFAHTYAGMQWQRYMEVVNKEFSEKYHWNDTKTQTFLSLSALYYDDENDFFKSAYEPGVYEIPVGFSRAQVAGLLIDTFAKKHEAEQNDNVLAVLDQKSMDNVAHMIEDKMELLPDIVALPAGDITLKKTGSKAYLQFTTSYWNKGRGPLELVGDPKTKGKREDIVRNVYQRVYQLDGDYRERLAGTFLWHQPHLHYHFEDFAVYLLEPVDVDGAKDVKWNDYRKSTFCVRDSEPIDLTHPGAKKGGSYNICGKERQGISPGWADSYYYTYVDQNFDVTKAPSGTYRLSIIINPKDRFDEITKANNKSEVLIKLDVEKGEVKVLQEISYEN